MAAEKTASEWFSVTVSADELAEAAIDTAFGILDSLGTEIDTLGKDSAETVRVVGYFDSPPAEETVRLAIVDALKIHGVQASAIRDVKFEKVVERDWLEEWKKHWTATHVGRFLIAPPWKVPNEYDEILITIDPSMAFGTGTHETTRLCLEFIGSHYSNGMSFLDVGTGTGILSIAAAKLNAKEPVEDFLACDTDELSVSIARENAEANGVAGIEFEVGSVNEENRVYDFVCANMTIDVISPMLPLLVSKAKRYLVLSGILTEQEETICVQLTELDLPQPQILRKGEWIALCIAFD